MTKLMPYVSPILIMAGKKNKLYMIFLEFWEIKLNPHKPDREGACLT